MTTTRTGARAIAGLALALATAACGEDDRPPTWSYLHEAIIVPGCTTPSCHNDQTAVAGIRLGGRAGAYAVLVGLACGDGEPLPPGASVRSYVDPGSPERSQLLYLLRGDEVRRPMPPDRLLAAGDVDLVERWILEGAPCD